MNKLDSISFANSLNDYPDLMTVSDMRSALSISRSLSYKLIREGTVQSIRVGNIIRIPKVCIVDFMEKACYAVCCNGKLGQPDKERSYS